MLRLEAGLEKLDDHYDSRVNYLWDEYELTYSIAQQFKNEEYTKCIPIEKKREQLKNEIRLWEM
jgi:chromosome segregation protein